MVTDSRVLEVDSLLNRLENDTTSASHSVDDRLKTLERLKVLGRDASISGAIFAPKGISLLAQYGLGTYPQAVSREALRCLANALFLSPSSRQTFIDLHYAGQVAERYNDPGDFENEFLLGRILLLITYETQLDYSMLIEEKGLANSLSQSMSRHLQSIPSPTEETALSEALKLVFNLMHHAHPIAHRFDGMLPELLKLLDTRQPKQDEAPAASISHLINALLNFDLAPQLFYPPESQQQHILILLNILDTTVKVTPVQQLDAAASPIISLLRRTFETAPASVKEILQIRLLPTTEDRVKPLGQSQTLPSQLLRLSVNGFTPILRDCVPDLLFELSDGDAETFVKNVGYGYASGYLTNNNIPAPSSETQRNEGLDDDIDFVTGQYLKDQPQHQQVEMTEEEKMREAERLFVLFERLKKTGVMDVQNPVKAAVQSGKFEELE